MKIVVLGASGRLGTELVYAATKAGHDVTAVVRAGASPIRAGRYRVVQMVDLADSEQLGSHLAGNDAVVSALGPHGRRDPGVTSRLTRSAIAAMTTHGVDRLVVTSAAPVGPREPGDSFLMSRVVTPIVRIFLGAVYAELTVMERELGESSLQWTAMRPPRLVNAPPRGGARSVIGGNVPRGASIGRADLADTMVRVLDDERTFGSVVGVAY